MSTSKIIKTDELTQSSYTLDGLIQPQKLKITAIRRHV